MAPSLQKLDYLDFSAILEIYIYVYLWLSDLKFDNAEDSIALTTFPISITITLVERLDLYGDV